MVPSVKLGRLDFRDFRRSAVREMSQVARREHFQPDVTGWAGAKGYYIGWVAGSFMILWTLVLTTSLGIPLLEPFEMLAEPFYFRVPYQLEPLDYSIVGLGIFGFIILSALFGLIFGVSWLKLGRKRMNSVVFGLIYGLIIWIVMGYIIGPIVSLSVAFQLPLWIWLGAHLIYGLVLGLWPILRPRDFPTVLTTPH